MKITIKVLGIFVMLVGLTMMVFAWIFFYEKEEAIIQLASLYLALSIAVVLFAMGVSMLRDKSE